MKLCQNCRFWAVSKSNRYERVVVQDNSPGECRRRAPVALQVSDGERSNAHVFDGWPSAMANHWCGEWEPNATAQMEGQE
jgi:hypothetical protein